VTPEQQAAFNTFTARLYDAIQGMPDFAAQIESLKGVGIELREVILDIDIVVTALQDAQPTVGQPMSLVEAARSVGVAPPSDPRAKDEAFLRSLRIKPDLEVRRDP